MVDMVVCCTGQYRYMLRVQHILPEHILPEHILPEHILPEHILDSVHVQVLDIQGPRLALPHIVVEHCVEHRRPGQVEGSLGTVGRYRRYRTSNTTICHSQIYEIFMIDPGNPNLKNWIRILLPLI